MMWYYNQTSTVISDVEYNLLDIQYHIMSNHQTSNVISDHRHGYWNL